MFDQVKLPQRVSVVEGCRRQLAGALLQRFAFALAAPTLEFFDHHMALDVEARVDLPVAAQRALHHTLAKALVLEQLVAQALAQHGVADARAQHPHAQDHHLVDLVVGAKPGRVDHVHGFGRGRGPHHFWAPLLLRSSRRKVLPMLLLGSGSVRNSIKRGTL